MFRFAIAVVAGTLLLAPLALAEMFLAGSLGSGAFSFRAQNAEPTPNYLGFSPGVQFGYSYRQQFASTFFVQHTLAGYQHFAQPNDASLTFAGFGFEGRFKTVALGVHGGLARYELNKTHDATHELRGQWHGTGAGVYLGGLVPLRKKQALQVAFEYNILAMKSQMQTRSRVRQLDQIMITLTYTFNEILSQFMGHTLFESLN